VSVSASFIIVAWTSRSRAAHRHWQRQRGLLYAGAAVALVLAMDAVVAAEAAAVRPLKVVISNVAESSDDHMLDEDGTSVSTRDKGGGVVTS
jgi:hypothetical protein